MALPIFADTSGVSGSMRSAGGGTGANATCADALCLLFDKRFVMGKGGLSLCFHVPSANAEQQGNNDPVLLPHVAES